MNFQLKNPASLQRIGLAALAIGGLARLFLHPADRMQQDIVDGLTGLMLGIAIPCLLMSLFKGRRRSV